jgi:uncharacterized protein HemX
LSLSKPTTFDKLRPRFPPKYWEDTRGRKKEMENLTLLAVVIIVLWLGVLAFYMFSSRQQVDLHKELDDLEKQMDQLEKKK